MSARLTLHIPEPTTADIAEAHAHRVVAAEELVAELVAALREARAYIAADLRQLLLSYCLLDRAGEPRLDTLDEGDSEGVAEANDALDRINAAIARAEGPTP